VGLFISNILLSLVWLGLTGQFTPVNFIIGFSLAYVLLWLTLGTGRKETYFKKVWQVIGFVIYFSWEFLTANFRVVLEILTPAHNMRPGIVAVPLDARTDLEIAAFANLITLTPGTLSLEVSADKSVLFVHAMYIYDAGDFKKHLKQGLERRLMEVMR
jgi:multicomponent Na+:H+ antiporter subunit E